MSPIDYLENPQIQYAYCQKMTDQSSNSLPIYNLVQSS